MTCFTVRKDEKTERLISWPRSQNSFMLEPDDVDLPDPGVFDSFPYDPRLRLAGFAVDLSNMFHNTRLPE